MTDWFAAAEEAKETGLFEDNPERALDNSLRQALDSDPAAASEASQINRETGIANDVVERNVIDARKVNQYKNISARKILEDAPVTGEFLTDIDNAKQAHQDIKPLSAIEKVTRGYERGVLVDEAGLTGYKQLLQYDPDRQAQLDAINKRISELDPAIGESGFFTEFADPASEIFGQMMRGIGHSTSMVIQGAVAGGMTAFAAGQMGPQIAVPEEVITVPGGAMLGAGWGLRMGIAKHAFQVEAGHAFTELLAVKNEAGETLEPELARAGALGVGLINASLEMVGFEHVSKPYREVIKRYTTQYVKDALRDATMRHVFTNFAKRYALAWGTETATEVVQEIVNMEAVELMKGLSESDFENMSQEEWNERLYEIFNKVGHGMALLALPGASMNIRADVNAARNQKTDAERIADLNAAAAESGLRKNNPTAFRELVKRMADENSNTVYLNPDEANILFQGGTIMPDQMNNPAVQQIMGDIPKAIEEGRDVQIPIENYATDIVGTPLEQAFAPHIRIDPDALTETEAEDSDITAKIAELAAMDEETRAAETEVYNDIVGQLTGLGYERSAAEQYAIMHEAFFSTMAQRSGKNARELYESYGLQISREADPRLTQRAADITSFDIDLDRLRAGDLPKDADIFGTSALEFILEKGGIKDESGELAARDADKGRVGKNRIARKTGKSLDYMGEALAEAGYIPTDYDEAAVLDIIDRGLAGEPVYVAGEENAELQTTRANLESLSGYLDEAGIDLAAMTNEQVREQLVGPSENVLSQTQDFGDIDFTETVEVEGRAEPVTVTQKAQKRFDSLIERRNVVQKLKGCLSGA